MQHAELDCLVTPAPGASIDDLVARFSRAGIIAAVEGGVIRVFLPATSLKEFSQASDAVYRTPGVAGLSYPPATQQRYAALDRASRPKRWP